MALFEAQLTHGLLGGITIIALTLVEAATYSSSNIFP